MKTIHELNEADFDRRVNLCEFLSYRVNRNFCGTPHISRMNVPFIWLTIDKLCGEQNLNLLNNEVSPFSYIIYCEMRVFQQDPPHFVESERQILDNNFSGRCIGTSGSTVSLSRYPNLTPLSFDFLAFLYGNGRIKCLWGEAIY